MLGRLYVAWYYIFMNVTSLMTVATDNSNSDNLNFLLTQLKSYNAWISPHVLVIFTWLTSTGIS